MAETSDFLTAEQKVALKDNYSVGKKVEKMALRMAVM